MGGHAIWVREGSALLIPDLSPPPQTCLDFYQDKNAARRVKVLKLKRSGLGYRLALERKHCPIWGPA